MLKGMVGGRGDKVDELIVLHVIVVPVYGFGEVKVGRVVGFAVGVGSEIATKTYTIVVIHWNSVMLETRNMYQYLSAGCEEKI